MSAVRSAYRRWFSLPIRDAAAQQIEWKPVATADEHSFFVDADGELGAWTLEDGVFGSRRMMRNDGRYTGVKFASVTSSTSSISQMIALVSLEGGVYTLGNGEYGRLGHGDCAPYMRLTKVAALDGFRVTSVAADWHCLAVTDTGVAFGWGFNNEGQCGLGDRRGRDRILSPSRITMPDAPDTIWCFASVGAEHSLLVDVYGTVHACGSGSEGALGNGSMNRSLPAPVHLPGKCIAVAAGTVHSLAVTAEGDVFAWGDDYMGELGVIVQGEPIGVIKLARGEHLREHRRRRGAPVVGELLTYAEPLDEFSAYRGQYALSARIDPPPRFTHIPMFTQTLAERRYDVPDGVAIQQVFAPRFNLTPDLRTVRTPQRVRQLRNVKMVSAFKSASCAVTREGELYTWGTRVNDIEGHPPVTTSKPTRVELDGVVVAASMSNLHTIAVTAEGRVFRWNERIGAAKQLIYTYP